MKKCSVYTVEIKKDGEVIGKETTLEGPEAYVTLKVVNDQPIITVRNK